MKKGLIWSIVLLLSISFTSCIEILDEITLNKDKSGSVFIGVESKLLGSLLGMAKDQVDPKLINDLEEFPSKSKKKLSNVKGITNVKSFESMSSGRIGISFKFDKPQSLNNAYYALVDVERKWYSPNIVSISRHKIQRKNLTPHLVEQIEKEKPGLKDAEYLKYISYSSVIILPSPSKSVENEKITEERSTKKVVMKYSLTEILKDEKSTAFKIRF